VRERSWLNRGALLASAGRVNRRQFLQSTAVAGIAAAAGAALTAGCRGRAGGAIRQLTVDWAYYSPLSMVLRKHGWLDEALGRAGVAVQWVLPLGSNQALDLLPAR
jgi:sulfonate transport system substrate-binding protein